MGIVELEQPVPAILVAEQAFVCRNVNLAPRALGLGGWTFTGHLARFMMCGGDVPGLGVRFAAGADGSTLPVDRDGRFEALTPPYHADMRAAVHAVMEVTWAVFEDDAPKPYLEPDTVVSGVPRPHPHTLELVRDRRRYCRDTHGRFPGYADPMCRRLTVRARHAGPGFDERSYPPGALTGRRLAHFERWHPETGGEPPRRPPGGDGGDR